MAVRYAQVAIAPGSGGYPLAINPTVYTVSGFTALVNQENRFKFSSGGAKTIFLPVGPSVGDQVVLRSLAGPIDPGFFVLTVNGNGNNIANLASSGGGTLVLAHDFGFQATFIYTGERWRIEQTSLHAAAALFQQGRVRLVTVDVDNRTNDIFAGSNDMYLYGGPLAIAFQNVNPGQVPGRDMSGSAFSTPLTTQQLANMVTVGLNSFTFSLSGLNIGNNNNLSMGTSFDRSRATLFSAQVVGAVITGIIPGGSDLYGFNPRKLFYNGGTDPIDFTHEDVNSSGANRFRTKNSLTYTLGIGSHVWVEYVNLAGGRWFIDS